MVGDGTYERRIHLAKILEGASPDAPNFFGSAGALPSRKNHLPVANRHSLPFYNLSCNDNYETE
jgi:hypothetical protein